MKTTYERPHLRRGLPGRGVSPIGWLQTELAIGNQVHIPLLRSQVRQKRPARPFQAPSDCVTRLRARPRIPSRAGTSCVAGASTARSRVGQPSPMTPNPQVRQLPCNGTCPGGVDAGLPAVPAPKRSRPSPVGPPPSRRSAFKAESACPARFGILCARPVPACAVSRLARRFDLQLAHDFRLKPPSRLSPDGRPCQARTL